MKVSLKNKNEIELAKEFAGMVGKSVVFTGDCLECDAEESIELKELASDASRYWLSRGKKALAKAADRLREVFSEIECNERYLRSFER